MDDAYPRRLRPAHPRAWSGEPASLDVSPAARVIRAALAAALCAGTAVSAHVLAGGHRPSVAATIVLLAVTFVVTLMVANALAGRRLSAPRVGVLVAVGQGVHHALLSVLPSAPHPGLAPHFGAHAHHLHGADGVDALIASQVATQAAHDPSALMVAAHAVAALFTAWGVLYGERLFWAVRDEVIRPALRVWALPALPVPTRQPRIGPPAHDGFTGPDTPTLLPARRGPPAFGCRVAVMG